MRPMPLSQLVFIFLLQFALLSLSPCGARAEWLDNWTLRNPRFTANSLLDVAYGNGSFVAVGDGGTVMTSLDGANWVLRQQDPTLTFRSILRANGRFVALGGNGTLLTSLDGTNWISRFDAPNYLADVAFGNGQFVAFGESGSIAVSSDGLIWSNRTVSLASSGQSIAFGNGVFVVVGGYPPQAHVSSNLLNWANPPMPGNLFQAYRSVTFGNNLFVTVGDSGQIVTSSNGVNWAAQNSGFPLPLTAVSYANGRFISLAQDPGFVLSSTDGTNWLVQPTSLTGSDRSLNGVAFGNGACVAVGVSGSILRSGDGAAWAVQASGISNILYGISFGAGRFVAVGESGRVLRSLNGSNWLASTVNSNAQFSSVAHGNGTFVTVGDSYDPISGESGPVVYTSPDGASWTRSTVPLFFSSSRVVFGNGRFVVASQDFDTGQFRVFSSTDGMTWTCHASNIGYSQISFGAGEFLTFGSDDVENATVALSTDAANWFVEDLGAFDNPDGPLACGGDTFVTVGYGGVHSSISGLSWTNRVPAGGVPPSVLNVAFGAGTFVAVGYDGLILQSDPASAGPTQAPTIVEPPQSQVAVVGSSAGFGVGATGSSPLRYRWRRNGVALPGATNAFLILPSVTTAQSGIYSVAVSNAFGGAMSAPAALTVIEPDPLDYWQFGQSGLSMEMDANLTSVCFGNGRFVAVGSPNLILSSPEGINWLRSLPPQPRHLHRRGRLRTRASVRSAFQRPACHRPATSQSHGADGHLRDAGRRRRGQFAPHLRMVQEWRRSLRGRQPELVFRSGSAVQCRGLLRGGAKPVRLRHQRHGPPHGGVRRAFGANPVHRGRAPHHHRAKRCQLSHRIRRPFEGYQHPLEYADDIRVGPHPVHLDRPGISPGLAAVLSRRAGMTAAAWPSP